MTPWLGRSLVRCPESSDAQRKGFDFDKISLG